MEDFLSLKDSASNIVKLTYEMPSLGRLCMPEPQTLHFFPCRYNPQYHDLSRIEIQKDICFNHYGIKIISGSQKDELELHHKLQIKN